MENLKTRFFLFEKIWSPVSFFTWMPYLENYRMIRMKVRMEMYFILPTRTGNEVWFLLWRVWVKKEKNIPAAGNWTYGSCNNKRVETKKTDERGTVIIFPFMLVKNITANLMNYLSNWIIVVSLFLIEKKELWKKKSVTILGSHWSYFMVSWSLMKMLFRSFFFTIKQLPVMFQNCMQNGIYGHKNLGLNWVIQLIL